jgi:NADPH2:quinone reductase
MTSGGYATRAVVRVASLQPLPDELDTSAAIAMIGTGRTAMGVLELAAAMTPDDVVLVPAAAGGLGNLFVQQARNLGATVIGLAGGPAKVALVEELGADLVLDSNTGRWPASVRDWLGDREVTLLLDGVGGEAGRAAFELLGVGGRAVVFGWSAGEPTRIATDDILAKGLTVSAIGPRLLRRPGGWRDLETAALAEAATGRWVPLVDEYPMKEASWAHAALEGRATTGKVVLRS